MGTQIRKYNANELAGIEAAGGWTVTSVITSSTATEGNVQLAVTTFQILVQTTTDIYISFSTADTDCIDGSNDLYLTGGDTIHVLRVPYGLVSTIGGRV